MSFLDWTFDPYFDFDTFTAWPFSYGSDWMGSRSRRRRPTSRGALTSGQEQGNVEQGSTALTQQTPSTASTALTPFTGFGAGMDDLWVRMDIKETPDSVQVTADVPGFSAQDLQVHLDDNNVLSIAGERRSESVQQDERLRFQERSVGYFTRRVRLPDGVDKEKVDAKVDKGVLQIKIGKGQRTAKRIEIKASQESAQSGQQQQQQ